MSNGIHQNLSITLPLISLSQIGTTRVIQILTPVLTRASSKKIRHPKKFLIDRSINQGDQWLHKFAKSAQIRNSRKLLAYFFGTYLFIKQQEIRSRPWAHPSNWHPLSAAAIIGLGLTCIPNPPPSFLKLINR